jgi:molecular chaperone DnaK (HSP70)
MSTIAIDFGTSNTIVCDLDPLSQSPRVIKFKSISRKFEGSEVYAVPTLVFVENDGRFIFGQEVCTGRKGLSKADKNRRFQAFKRAMVADYQSPPLNINNKLYDSQLIAECFLENIWQELAKQNIEPTRAIFTVPVGSFERYLDWFRDFANKLKIQQVHLVDESTAAALGYAINKIGSLVLVVDLGGGTLDLSLVRTKGDNQQQIIQAEVLAKSDAYVGGVDIDSWIVEHYLAKINASQESIGEMGWSNLLEVAERLKIKLSTSESHTESWFDDENFMAHELILERSELAEILESRQLLSQIREALDEVLTYALSKGIKKNDIEQVLLVGGSSQIPAIQQLIISYFGPNKVKLDKPFEAVAYGALLLSKLVEVEDYLRHGYAIRVWDPFNKFHIHHAIFKAGSKYPCKSEYPITLQVARDGQKKINLDIGEIAETSRAEVNYDSQGRMTTAELVKATDFRSLESEHRTEVCIAHLNPAGKAGEDRISVEFEVNQQRILTATVFDLVTGEKLADKEAIAKLK